MNHERSFDIDEWLSASWHQRLARDLASEAEHVSAENRCLIPELRRFFATKAYRDLLAKMKTACEGKTSFDALKSVARSMQLYALERPALWAATSQTPAVDCAEWQAGYHELCDRIKSVLAECGVHGVHAEDALFMLRSLVRGFAVHQILGSSLDFCSCEESFERIIEIYVAGVRSVAIADANAAASN
jgi:hypothetical protein